ncbi:Hypothetical predicted protein [Olea europaea subsp. europaea]|uniref:J domain-containing protein n=1 Tax=Olea europaea subsp. europaea TaxID=158383 RepID=A0A8S0QCC1_OLEEU|nr:Hypothetical predicted protein [Olea europaea subsp. europaea]
MSCAVVSGFETRFHFCSTPNRQTRNRIPKCYSNISFCSQLTNSRIPIKIPWGRTSRAHFRSSFKALYKTESFYNVLGIEESGTISDIKKAYKEMARKYHPDVSPLDRVNENTRRFILVKEAYETLSDPHIRALYDQDLANGLGFNFSAGRGYEYKQRYGEWKEIWQSQLDELKLRRMDSEGRMSWGARMRSRR